MKLAKVVLLAGVVSLAACKKSSKEDEKYGAGGLCTSGAINAFNYINTHSDSSSEYTLREVQQQCTNLQNSLGGGECKAVVVATGQTTWASFSRVASNCASVKAKLDPSQKPVSTNLSPAPSPTPAPFRSGDNCNEEVIKASNDLLMETILPAYNTDAELKKSSRDCDRLQALLPNGGYCKARTLAAGVASQIDYFKFSDSCERVNKEIQDRILKAAKDGLELTLDSNDIMLTPLKQYEIAKFLSQDLKIENGNVTTFQYKDSFCQLVGNPTSAEIKLISEVRSTWRIKSVNGRNLTLQAAAYPVDLSCDLSAPADKWTVQELRKVFGTLVLVESL